MKTGMAKIGSEILLISFLKWTIIFQRTLNFHLDVPEGHKAMMDSPRLHVCPFLLSWETPKWECLRSPAIKASPFLSLSVSASLSLCHTHMHKHTHTRSRCSCMQRCPHHLSHCCPHFYSSLSSNGSCWFHTNFGWHFLHKFPFKKENMRCNVVPLRIKTILLCLRGREERNCVFLNFRAAFMTRRKSLRKRLLVSDKVQVSKHNWESNLEAALWLLTLKLWGQLNHRLRIFTECSLPPQYIGSSP